MHVSTGDRVGDPDMRTVITEDMPHTVLRRRARTESVEDIGPDLLIPQPASARAATRAWPAPTGHSPSTRNAGPTPKPSTRPTPTSPRSSGAPDTTERPTTTGQPYSYPPGFRRVLRRPLVTVNFVLQVWAQKLFFDQHSLISPEGAAPRTPVSRLGSRAQPRQSLAHSAREGCSGHVFRVEMDAAVEPAGV